MSAKRTAQRTYSVISKRGDKKLIVRIEAIKAFAAAKWAFKTAGIHSYKLLPYMGNCPVYEVEWSYETDEDVGAKFWCFFDGLKHCNNVSFYITKGKHTKAHLDGYGIGNDYKAQEILFAAGFVKFGTVNVLGPNNDRTEIIIDDEDADELEAKMTTLFDGARRYFGLSAYV